MIKLKINSFKSGLFWYACCEIPPEEHETYYYDNQPFAVLPEEHETYYYDNQPFAVLLSPITLHCVGLTHKSVNNKMFNKLRQYYNERKNSND